MVTIPESIQTSWLAAVMCALVVLTQGLGCKPEFTDEQCTSDAECFINEVCGPAGVCVAKPPVMPISVRTFAADPARIMAGESSTLSWSVENATSVTIAGSDGSTFTAPATSLSLGMTTVSPAETTTYTLTAAGEGNPVTRMATVTVTPPDAPTIQSFNASAQTVEAGAQVTLSWETTGATSAEITGGESPYVVPAADLDRGTTRVTLNMATTFTLTVTNAVGQQSAMVSVAVTGQPPTISSFTASPETIVTGSTSTLAWQTAGAASVTITDTSGALVPLDGAGASQGSVMVTPTRTLGYTLTATNPFGSVTRSVEVTLVPVLSVTSFTATPSTVGPNAPVTLAWQISGVPTSVQIQDGDGNMIDIGMASLLSGNVQITPAASTTYTLTATDALQSATSSVSVTVLPDLPVINTFTASASTLNQGADVTLSWTTTGADALALVDDEGTTVDISAQPVAAGSITFPATRTATFTLTATNAAGQATATANFAVGVFVSITSFTATPTTGLAGDSVVLAWQTVGATNLSISASDNSPVDTMGKNLAADSVSLIPAAGMTTYTLEADGFAGPVTAQVTVNIAPQVGILNFGASSNLLISGQSVTLSWTTVAATGLTLVATVGGVDTPIDISSRNIANDTFTLTPTQTTTYTLTATGAMGSSVSSFATVTVYTPASITSFSADRTTITSGEQITLSWQTQGATSLSIINQLGQPVALPMGVNFAADSITVRPQLNTSYTLIVSGEQSSNASQSVSITVGAAPLLITEFLINPAGADDQKEWVEIMNTGEGVVDLANYSLANGGVDWAVSRVQLAGLLPPGACAVIGGPISDDTNANPVYFQEVRFNPNFQNGGATAADGVALFFLPASSVNATSVPIDAILYDPRGGNSSGLIGPDGMVIPNDQISPLPGDSVSLERISPTSRIFRLNTNPTPGRCFTIDQLTGTTRAPNEASGTLRFTGFGLDLAQSTITLGAQTLTCTSPTPGSYECPLAAPGAMVTGDQTLTITQTQRVGLDMNNQPVGVMIPPAEQPTLSRTNAFFWEGRLDDPGADFFCGLFAPANPTANAGDPINISGEIYIDGTTNSGSGELTMGAIVQGGYFTRGATPYNVFDVEWSDGVQTATFGGPFNSNVIYEMTLVSSVARQAEAAMRLTLDGTNYYYCDLSSAGGSDDGWTPNGGALVEWQ